MKAIWLVLMLASCAAVKPIATDKDGIGLSFSENVNLDSDKILVCGYSYEINTLLCVTVEEFAEQAKKRAK